MATDDYAVVVGINKYPYLSDLDGPEYDALDFADWLYAPTGGNVPSPPNSNVRLILSSNYPSTSPEPAEWQICNAFENLCRLGESNNGRAGRRLYIFMAGHGFSPNVDETALLTANAAKGYTGHNIPGRMFANWFAMAGYFDEVVLFMDCCRDNYKRANLYQFPCDDRSSSRSVRRFYGFATEWSRAVRERPIGPNGQNRGPFTMALLAGLRGAAKVNGSITGSSLKNYVYNKLPSLIGTDELQEPRFDPSDDIVFM
jgi:hypothetical protein